MGVLGSLIDKTDDTKRSILEEAVKGANDLTGLVKRRKAANGVHKTESTDDRQGQNAKRKADVVEEEESVSIKRPKADSPH